ncbi:DNA mismatch repair protein MutS [Garciella nitratireducens]|uniref:DNA mismatch repair protein MutS n=1 Tax=Garciella nitratireducens DSM 15102 TaxID=1121911 RepID=A0A1T4JVG9_9FIRM|nr:DNA mismatch repair protein MutS [Garciella nitratireducens]SJZ34141.1 DNA mismatch repair protein MutS [Garciella nitratireducens DSM 15102]
MAKLTPMMEQYLKIHDQVKDAILFFRLGDFYEMFFDDAILASKELEITLTGRDCGLEERAPMCGVPYHSAETYIAKLIEKGYKVAICEQVEDPSEAKGIVRREITRIISPGTVIDGEMLDDNKNNYLLCIYYEDEQFGLGVTDISTGEFMVSEIQHSRSVLIDEIGKLNPSEIITNNSLYKNKELKNLIEEKLNIKINPYPNKYFNYKECEKKIKKHFHVYSLTSVDLDAYPIIVKAAGALIQYLEQTQKNALSHINQINRYAIEEYMLLDLSTRRNLELTETIRGKEKKGSLLWVIDKTLTSMGARLLRQWVEQPLLNKEQIQKRLDGVEEIYHDIVLRKELENLLKKVYDIQRLITRISYGNANARDLLSLKQSIGILPELKKILSKCNSALLKQIYDQLDTLEDIFSLINQGIIEDPPQTIKEGNIIKDGFNKEVDKYRDASRFGKQWIKKMEQEEKKKTGIKSLKIRFNKVFGYYIEVTKSNLHLVPDYFIRKQTLANSERYFTHELKEIEDKILGAEDKVVQLEYKIFQNIRERILSQIIRIQSSAKCIAFLDAIWSLATIAYENHYVKPVITNKDEIDIKEGRHPVVENMMDYSEFVPNDCKINCGNNRIMLITGPNMAGKSTYMRQVALIVLMAQIGSFVPAKQAKIGIVDRIFTRVGASDDLASGQSTFMVEMSEVSNILKNASKNSLVILDEIGRGTSTFDGLSIAWAVIEYINDKKYIGCKTLFATHYHELTVLEDQLEGVKNYSIAVKEENDNIVFLREIISGKTDQSYGIQVAKIAGLPDEVIKRSKEILNKLEFSDSNKKRFPHEKYLKTAITKERKEINTKNYNDNNHLTLFNYKYEEIIQKIKSLQLDRMTPIEIMNYMYKLQKNLKNE